LSSGVVVLLMSEEGRKLAQRKCKAAGLDLSVLRKLIDAEVNQMGKLRKRGLYEDFDEIFGEIDEEDEN